MAIICYTSRMKKNILIALIFSITMTGCSLTNPFNDSEEIAVPKASKNNVENTCIMNKHSCYAWDANGICVVW